MSDNSIQLDESIIHARVAQQKKQMSKMTSDELRDKFSSKTRAEVAALEMRHGVAPGAYTRYMHQNKPMKIVISEQWGEGVILTGDDNGLDVMFEHGIERNIPYDKVDILVEDEDQLAESELMLLVDRSTKLLQLMQGGKFAFDGWMAERISQATDMINSVYTFLSMSPTDGGPVMGTQGGVAINPTVQEQEQLNEEPILDDDEAQTFTFRTKGGNARNPADRKKHKDVLDDILNSRKGNYRPNFSMGGDKTSASGKANQQKKERDASFVSDRERHDLQLRDAITQYHRAQQRKGNQEQPDRTNYDPFDTRRTGMSGPPGERYNANFKLGDYLRDVFANYQWRTRQRNIQEDEQLNESKVIGTHTGKIKSSRRIARALEQIVNRDKALPYTFDDGAVANISPAIARLALERYRKNSEFDKAKLAAKMRASYKEFIAVIKQ